MPPNLGLPLRGPPQRDLARLVGGTGRRERWGAPRFLEVEHHRGKRLRVGAVDLADRERIERVGGEECP